MRGNLAVKIVDGDTSRHVTPWAKDLSFRKTAPGGHHSASMRLILPRDTFRDLGPADRVYVYDARTGKTIWEGYTENPGVTDGPQGQEYDLSAMGGMVLASDESRALVYIDRDLGQWTRSRYSAVAASATMEPSTDPAGVLGDGLLLQFNPGQPISTGQIAEVIYGQMRAAEMAVGAVRVTHDSGKTDAGYEIRVITSGGGTIQSVVTLSTMTTTPNSITRWSSNHFPAGADIVSLNITRTGGATNVADDNTYTILADVSVIGGRVDRYGSLISGATPLVSADYVRVDWVVEDLLGRVLGNVCDPDSAVIDAGTFDIDQLAYHDGATAQRVFDDLALYEPDMTWEILESTGSGHRFNYRAWPTKPRYEISVKDGYEAPGGEIDLCNRIAVYWTDAQGRKQATTVTATVPELGNRTRDAEAITLPDGMGSAANAQRIGEQVLEQKNNPAKAARAVVRRPIIDHLTGTTVMPWEIEPGYLVRVRETGEDLRLTEMDYADNDCATTLTLGEPTRTFDQLLAGMGRRG